MKKLIYTILTVSLLFIPQTGLCSNQNNSDDSYKEYKNERAEKSNNVKTVNKSLGRAVAQTYFTNDRKALVKKKALRKTASEDMSVTTKKKKTAKTKKKSKHLPKKKTKAKNKKKKTSP